jgi:hypothetical protein
MLATAVKRRRRLGLSADTSFDESVPQMVWALVYEPVDPVVDAERLSYRRRYCQRLAAGLNQAIAAGELRARTPS